MKTRFKEGGAIVVLAEHNNGEMVMVGPFESVKKAATVCGENIKCFSIRWYRPRALGKSFSMIINKAQLLAALQS